MSIAGAVHPAKAPKRACIAAASRWPTAPNLPFKPHVHGLHPGPGLQSQRREPGREAHLQRRPAAGRRGSEYQAVKVDLPKQLPSRLTTLQKACTEAQFNADPAGCPAASDVGDRERGYADPPHPV